MALAAAASAVLAAASARCEERQAPPPAGYGAQIGGLDLLSATGLLLAGATGSAPVAFASLGLFVLGGPIAHFAHARAGAGLTSLAVRVLLPAGLGYVGEPALVGRF
jgi:hypothetical protein